MASVYKMNEKYACHEALIPRRTVSLSKSGLMLFKMTNLLQTIDTIILEPSSHHPDALIMIICEKVDVVCPANKYFHHKSPTFLFGLHTIRT